MSQQKRYRVGIDVGLYSVGLAAIAIDDNENIEEALPTELLSVMSVIHDGALDPDSQKVADSRKLKAGIARRTRKLHKQERSRLKALDELLTNLGYPLVDLANAKDPYLPWRARIEAAQSFIKDGKARKEAVSISLRHIARHRGWRNPYASVNSLAEQSAQNREFYQKLFQKIEEWKADNGLEPGWNVRVNPENPEELLMPDWKEDGVWDKRPTPAELVRDFLEPVPGVRIRANRDSADGSTPNPSVQVGMKPPGFAGGSFLESYAASASTPCSL